MGVTWERATSTRALTRTSNIHTRPHPTSRPTYPHSTHCQAQMYEDNLRASAEAAAVERAAERAARRRAEEEQAERLRAAQLESDPMVQALQRNITPATDRTVNGFGKGGGGGGGER